MSRKPKFDGNQKKHVIGLLKAHGLRPTQSLLAEKNNAERSVKLFPKPVKVSLPTLIRIAKDAKVSFKLGRPNPLTNANERKMAISAVRQHGAVQAVEVLKAKGITVCAATLRKLAVDAGVKLKRGPRAKKAA